MGECFYCASRTCKCDKTDESRQAKRQRRRMQREAGKLLSLATRALCAIYNSDPTQPSIIVSHLKSNKFYMSVVRYNQAFAGDKRIMYKTRRAEFEDALYDVANWIVGLTKQHDDRPGRDLRRLMRMTNETSKKTVETNTRIDF